jgi:hypothetical protein
MEDDNRIVFCNLERRNLMNDNPILLGFGNFSDWRKLPLGKDPDFVSWLPREAGVYAIRETSNKKVRYVGKASPRKDESGLRARIVKENLEFRIHTGFCRTLADMAVSDPGFLESIVEEARLAQSGRRTKPTLIEVVRKSYERFSLEICWMVVADGLHSAVEREIRSKFLDTLWNVN